jgi:hypothetical protein
VELARSLGVPGLVDRATIGALHGEVREWRVHLEAEPALRQFVAEVEVPADAHPLLLAEIYCSR